MHASVNNNYYVNRRLATNTKRIVGFNFVTIDSKTVCSDNTIMWWLFHMKVLSEKATMFCDKTSTECAEHCLFMVKA